MTILPLPMPTQTATAAAPGPSVSTGDRLVRVRVSAPEVAGSSAIARETLTFDEQHLLDNISAVARRAAAAVGSADIPVLANTHDHPEHAACLRCLVFSVSRSQTMAAVLLDVLARANTDEEWNNDPEQSTDAQIVSRLRRLAVNEVTMAEIYGPRWALIILTCMRIADADFDMLTVLTRDRDDQLLVRAIESHSVAAARHALAAYHLAGLSCPYVITRDGEDPRQAKWRYPVTRVLGKALGDFAAWGELPEWLDSLPEPNL